MKDVCRQVADLRQQTLARGLKLSSVIPTGVEESLTVSVRSSFTPNNKRCLHPFDFAQGKTFGRHDNRCRGRAWDGDQIHHISLASNLTRAQSDLLPNAIENSPAFLTLGFRIK